MKKPPTGGSDPNAVTIEVRNGRSEIFSFSLFSPGVTRYFSNYVYLLVILDTS